MKVSIYARISTKKQETENQIHKLKEYAKLRDWELEGVYTDVIKGKIRKRPGLDEMLDKVKSGMTDGVLVWKLDRLARSVKDAIEISEFLSNHNRELIIFGSSIDTSTAEGRFFFNVTASFAELEASFISERTKLAYDNKSAHAKILGQKVRWGRKRKALSVFEIAEIDAHRRAGKSWRMIANIINNKRMLKKGKYEYISYSSLRRLFQKGGTKKGGVANREN